MNKQNMMHIDNGKLLKNKNSLILLIYISIWMNFEIISLSQRSQAKKVNIVLFHLFKILQTAYYSIVTAYQWLCRFFWWEVIRG